MPERNSRIRNDDNWMHRPLAIVGMACRLPGADSLEEFWSLLERGGYAIDELPASKVDRDLYFATTKGKRGHTYSTVGGLISKHEVDPTKINLRYEEMQQWDRSHLLLCEVAAEALENAGLDPAHVTVPNTGVYIGHSGGTEIGGELAYRTLLEDYLELLQRTDGWSDLSPNQQSVVFKRLRESLGSNRPQRTPDGGPFVDAGFASALISRAFKLTGPSLVIDAACASSLTALALASASLHASQIDMALVGGASHNKCDSLILFSQAQSCSATGSRPFDATADGLVSSEGYVVLVIKTLQRALADGDPIQAVIRGVGVASDGRGKSLWAPRKEGQVAAIERAYSSSVPPSSVQMVEAHATSTQVGDATEMEALAAFFRPYVEVGNSIPVGSVKSNIGHTLETAGLAGLVKTVLAIKHGVVPPSINIANLTASIPWKDIPLKVATHATPWQSLSPGEPRRAAVNAFGIGGLNVHVVVDEYLPNVHDSLVTDLHDFQDTTRARARVYQQDAQPARDAIAIIGRGLVVPGALNLDRLQDNLRDPKSWLSQPPIERWPGKKSLAVGGVFQEVVAGFITEFQYDWRKHRVPPKQIAQANPLQFMLLEAAEQALSEAGCLEANPYRKQTAVVVGSLFGGDFGNSLYGGLRLPEWRKQLLETLSSVGTSPSYAQGLADQYERIFLEYYPALLDETGSFTSSTLASRLSKTFDLMGGAMAIDAGDVSGLAALDSAIQLLRSGSVKQVLCASAQRSLDRAAMERIILEGRIRKPNDATTQNDHLAESILNMVAPAEGVVLLVLKPLSTAMADGDVVYATIQDVSVDFASFSPQLSSHRASAKLRKDPQVTPFVSQAAQQAGSLLAAQGLMDVVESTISLGSAATVEVSGATRSGLSYCVAIANKSGRENLDVMPSDPQANEAGSSRSPDATPNSHLQSQANRTAEYDAETSFASVAVRHHSHSSSTGDFLQLNASPLAEQATERLTPVTLRFEAGSCLLLSEALRHSRSCAFEDLVASHSHAYRSPGAWRAALVVHRGDYQSKLELLANQVGDLRSKLPLAEQGLFWRSPTRKSAKVAWLFPGQGSQYPRMLQKLVQSNKDAEKALNEANGILEKIGQPSFASLAWNEQTALGEDVWQTQIAMLIADYIVLCALRAKGYVPHLVTGHSFGEFAAMLAAGCWDLETAIMATWYRSQAIQQNVAQGYSMLSISCDQHSVQRWITEGRIAASISHCNAPSQTVVGGKQSSVAQLAQRLEAEGINCRLLAVPTAFHTSALAPAQQTFQESLREISIAPPSIPLLSSITNRYEADPDAIKENLVNQLTRPLDFISLSQRLSNDGVDIAVEVGPHSILSRLLQQSVEPSVTCVSTDHIKREPHRQWLIAEACLQIHAERQEVRVGPPIDLTFYNTQAISDSDVNSTFVPVMHFDATLVRKQRRRMEADQVSSSVDLEATSVATPILHFDASQSRKLSNRENAKNANGGAVASVGSPVESLLQGVESTRSAPIPSVLSSTNAGDVSARASNSHYNNKQLASPPTKDSSGDRREALEKFLVDFVVEQTGYPSEIIELDWDIEADLGIDSIKKAQLFGELREFFDLESLGGKFSLDRFRSLRDIVVLLETVPGKGDWYDGISGSEKPGSALSPQSARGLSPFPEPVLGSPAPLHSIVSKRQEGPSQSSSSSASDLGSSLASFLIEFVVDQTGYPPEIVDLDADLEADLGIDSIKKAQLFGELREVVEFPATQSTSGRLDLSEFRTLRSVMDFLSPPDGVSGLPQVVEASPRVSTPAGEDSSGSSTRGACEDALDSTRQRTEDQVISDPHESDQADSLVITSTSHLVRHDELHPTFNLNWTAWPIRIETRLESERDSRYSFEFKEAVDANLRAMASRKNGRAVTHGSSESSGNHVLWKSEASRLAAELTQGQECLQAFQSCVFNSPAWKPIAPTRASTQVVDSSVHWLAAWAGPEWLLDGGGSSVAWKVLSKAHRTECLALELPGLVWNNVWMNSNGLLIAAGIVGCKLESQDDELNSQTEFSLRLGDYACKVNSALQLVDIGSLFHEFGDWWVSAVSVRESKRVDLSGRDGIVSIEQRKLIGQRGDVAEASQNLIRVGVDLRTGEVVCQARLRPWPHGPQVVRMDLARLSSHLDHLPALRNPRVERSGFEELQNEQRRPEVFANSLAAEECSVSEESSQDSSSSGSTNSQVGLTSRFVLRMVPDKGFDVPGRFPVWSGAAMVVGDNPIARQLESRLRSSGVRVFRVPGSDHARGLVEALDQAWNDGPVRHLFLASSCDADARTTMSTSAWAARRNRGLMSTYWLCQRWHQRVLESGWMDDVSLVAVTALGGDFGISGQVRSIEGGGHGGLLKSMLIESWVQGYRAVPIKVMDTHSDQSPAEVVDNIWRELANPTFDVEVAYRNGQRHVLRAIKKPTGPKRGSIRRGGTWVCTGGARGITAYVAESLAKRYRLALHLLGTAPAPANLLSRQVSDERGLRLLRSQVMTEARSLGKNPILAWQDTEKAIEIEKTLNRMREQGLEVHYHQCDVSNPAQVQVVLDRVRSISGSITGVLHGAGVGKDARFDRKQPEKVDQCIAAKVDGAMALMEATISDPLDVFIGFGSISGRFGANGHTDYSLANDMLCKCMDWYQAQRPEVHSVGFHWHAWGDIGMATKPETKLALEMIQMQFMPAAEGLKHLCEELESGISDSEVLITDDRYYRLFYPSELGDSTREMNGRAGKVATPLLVSSRSESDRRQIHTAELDPLKDPFLKEHLYGGKPLLPIVVGMELMLEGARAHLGHSLPLALHRVRAVQGMRFFSEQSQEVRIETEVEADQVRSRLCCDFHARDGRLVQANRVNMEAEVMIASNSSRQSFTRVALARNCTWERPQYPSEENDFFVGPSLRRLRGYALGADGIVGRIIAPALIELAGGGRQVKGWQLPSAALDACLFAVGILAWSRVAPGSALPLGFEMVRLGRQPVAGEACEVHAKLESATETTATFSFTLYGVDQEMIVDVVGYQVAWVGKSSVSDAERGVLRFH